MTRSTGYGHNGCGVTQIKMANKRRSRGKGKAKGRSRLWGWLLKLGLVGMVLLGALAVYLDAIVQEKFSGKRWAVPAKVFARPLELYAGARVLTRDDFLTELRALGYRQTNAADGPGQMSVGSSRIDVYTRGFQFFEGAEPAQRVSVQFNGVDDQQHPWQWRSGYGAAGAVDDRRHLPCA